MELTTIYFNDAADAWPKAPGVVAAVAEATAAAPHHPGRGTGPTRNPAQRCRELISRLLETTDPSRVVLAPCATHALNLALLGLRLPPGARVVTTVTEHNSVLRPLHHLAQRLGLTVETVGLGPDKTPDPAAFRRALAPGAALCVVNHVSNVTGLEAEVESLFALARQAGATTLLDASQSIGKIPVLPEALGADLVAFPGRKGLRGPAGTGCLWVSPRLELEQVLVGGTGSRSDRMTHPEDMPTRLEAGTPNLPALEGFAVALAWNREHSAPFHARAEKVGRRLYDGLREIPGVGLFHPAPALRWQPTVSFRLQNRSVEETGFILAESFGIVCRTGLHCASLIHGALGSAPEGTVRFSLSGANTPEEVEFVLDAVRRIAS